MASIRPYNWKHRCLQTQDIYVSIDKINGGYINIDRLLRIQGIKSVNGQSIIGLEAVLCTHIELTTPSHGTLQYTGLGWFLQPSASALTASIDAFAYKLHYLGQDSPTAYVIINYI